MTNEEINKYLTEQKGECWHVINQPDHTPYWCCKCESYFNDFHTPDFFTPEGFFKAWNWATEQEWWTMFLFSHFHGDYMEAIHGAINTKYIDPTTFAPALTKFLKER